MTRRKTLKGVIFMVLVFLSGCRQAAWRPGLFKPKDKILQDVNSIRLSVVADHGHNSDHELMASVVTHMLEACDMEVVGPEATGIEAMLEIHLHGGALSARYNLSQTYPAGRQPPPLGRYPHYLYTGAVVQGTISVNVQQKACIRRFRGVVDVAQAGCYYDLPDKPSDAPFGAALREASFLARVSETIAGLRGIKQAQPLIGALVREQPGVLVCIDGWCPSLIAEEILKTLNMDDTVPVLIEALKHENRAVQLSAAEILGDLKATSAVEPLISTLPILRGAAIEALGEIGDPRAVDALVSVLSNSDGTEQLEAAEALVRIGDPKAVEPMISALTGPQLLRGRPLLAKDNIIEFLGESGNRKAVPLLLEALSIAGDSEHVARTARSLGKLGDASVIGALRTKLSERSPYDVCYDDIEKAILDLERGR